MTQFQKGLELMDRPEIIKRIFFPRRASGEELTSRYGTNHSIEVDAGISIGCRFYPARAGGPNILFFHGNGEIVPDYDYVAHLYQERGLNLFVADYRGYGMSGGSPTAGNMIRDVHPLFRGFVQFLHDRGYEGRLFVMGRSLGSAPAIEAAYHFQQQLSGLIVESGFSSVEKQIVRLGVEHLFQNITNPVGFGNDLKIKEITIPTLIIHGMEDWIIPVGEGKALFSLSGAARKTSLFVPHAGHNDLMERGVDAYMDAIQEFAFTCSQPVRDA